MRFPVYVCAGAIALGVLASPAAANSFAFSMTFDGTDISLDSGSDTPDGATLQASDGITPGDSFTIDLHTAGDAYWNVLSDFQLSFPLSFATTQSAVRNADIETNWLLDGFSVFSTTESGVDQQEVHVGAQYWDLPSGLSFDTVLLTWVFNSIEPVGIAALDLIETVISASGPDLFEDFGSPGRPFFRSNSIEYVTSAVPLPATLPLMLGAIGGLVGIRRLRRSALS